MDDNGSFLDYPRKIKLVAFFVLMSRDLRFALWGVVCTWIVGWIFSRYPTLCEELYVGGVYRVLRMLLAAISLFIPFPVIYVFGVVLAYALVRSLLAFWKVRLWLPAVRKTLFFLLMTYICFQWMWGYCYYRPLPFCQAAELPVPDTFFLASEAARVSDSLHSLAGSELSTGSHEGEIHYYIAKVLSDHELPVFPGSRVKDLFPSGGLYRLSTLGFYFPFAGESYIDPSLIRAQRPFVKAHEMFHAQGVGDEGLCNYLAWLACSQSEDRTHRYSAYFSYLIYLLGDLRTKAPDAYRRTIECLDPITKRYMEERMELGRRYAPWMEPLRDWVYGSYLRSQGVSSGLESYGEFVQRIYWDSSEVEDFRK